MKRNKSKQKNTSINRKKQQLHLSIYFQDRFKKTDAKESNIQASRHNAKSKEILQMNCYQYGICSWYLKHLAKSSESTLN